MLGLGKGISVPVGIGSVGSAVGVGVIVITGGLISFLISGSLPKNQNAARDRDKDITVSRVRFLIFIITLYYLNILFCWF
jgi:hypothetical protein